MSRDVCDNDSRNCEGCNVADECNAAIHDPMTRAERYKQVLDEHNWQEPIGSDEVPREVDGRFVLVEESRITGRYWLTTRDTEQAIIDYYGGQDYAEDWKPVYVLDLDTGQYYQPWLSVTLEPVDYVPE